MFLEKYVTAGSVYECVCCGTCSSSINNCYRHPDGEAFIYCCDCYSFEFMRPLVLKDVAEKRMDSVDGGDVQ
jgi:hypothetical protein